MKITIAVPCYNEIENVPRFATELLPELRKLGMDFELLIVDDGSRDGTAEAAERLGVPELRLVRHPENRGLGAGIKTMFAEARGELLVTMDADLTFAPSDIVKLLDRYQKGDVDFVIGSHGLAGYPKEIPSYRVWVSKAANMVYSILAGRRVHGISSIFRLYRTEIVKNIRITTSGYETPAETFFRLIKAGRRYAEVPTPLGNRQFGTSKLNYKREIPRQLRLLQDIVLGRLDEPKKGEGSFRRWTPGIIAAIAVGVLYLLPNIMIPAMQREAGYDMRDYHPMSLNAPVLDEVMSYGSRIREVIDGHFRDGDAFVAEYKDRPTMWGNSFLAGVIGIPARVLGVRNPTPIFVLGDAFFPAAAVLAFFGLFVFLLRDRFAAAAASFLIVTFPNFSALRFGISEWNLEGLFNVLARMFDSGFSRIPVPSPGMAVFVGFLWALLLALDRPSRARVAFAGLLLGLTYPAYFYYGVFSWVALGIFGIILLALRSRQALQTAVWIGLLGLAATIPSLVKMISIRNLPNADELTARLGLEIGRVARLSPTSLVLVGALLLSFWFLGRRLERRLEAAFLSALLLATVVVTNLQLVLGFNIQPDHWGSRVNVYIYALGLLVAAVWAWEAFGGRARTLHMAAIVGSLFFFGVGLTEQTRAAMQGAFEYRIPHEVQEAFRWIDRNTPRDSVIVSPSSRTAAYVPFFTHANVYFAPACYTLATNEEILGRFAELAGAFGVSEKTFEDAFLGDADWTKNPIRAAELDPSYMLFCDTYTRYQKNAYVGGDSRRPVPQEVAEHVLARHRQALEAPPSSRLDFVHRADYLFFGPSEKRISSLDPARYANAALVYEKDGVRIYRIDADEGTR